MKTKYKYIHFDELLDYGYYCYNNKTDEDLGPVMYYSPWRQWVFGKDPVFNSSCLRDIADFLEQLNKAGGAKWGGVRIVRQRKL